MPPSRTRRGRILKVALDSTAGAPLYHQVAESLRHDIAEGMLTAFVPRPEEYGPAQMTDLYPEKDWEFVASDFLDLADSLGC